MSITTVFSTSPFFYLHDIRVTTVKGRVFTINILEHSNTYSGDLNILEIGTGPCINYPLKQRTPNAELIFDEALDTIVKYLNYQNDNDTINDIHNPCNTPFVSKSDQQKILQTKAINVTVRVN